MFCTSSAFIIQLFQKLCCADGYCLNTLSIPLRDPTVITEVLCFS